MGGSTCCPQVQEVSVTKDSRPLGVLPLCPWIGRILPNNLVSFLNQYYSKEVKVAALSALVFVGFVVKSIYD